MIKNASLLGESIVVTGSDTGHVFFYDKFNHEVVNILRADEHIVNIVEPHPLQPFSSVAVSGIDSTIKLYTPFESSVPDEHVFKNSRINEKMAIIAKNNDHVHSQYSFNPANLGCIQS